MARITEDINYSPDSQLWEDPSLHSALSPLSSSSLPSLPASLQHSLPLALQQAIQQSIVIQQQSQQQAQQIQQPPQQHQTTLEFSQAQQLQHLSQQLIHQQQLIQQLQQTVDNTQNQFNFMWQQFKHHQHLPTPVQASEDSSQISTTELHHPNDQITISLGGKDLVQSSEIVELVTGTQYVLELKKVPLKSHFHICLEPVSGGSIIRHGIHTNQYAGSQDQTFISIRTYLFSQYEQDKQEECILQISGATNKSIKCMCVSTNSSTEKKKRKKDEKKK